MTFPLELNFYEVGQSLCGTFARKLWTEIPLCPQHPDLTHSGCDEEVFPECSSSQAILSLFKPP